MILFTGVPSGVFFLIAMGAILWVAWKLPDPTWLNKLFRIKGSSKKASNIPALDDAAIVPSSGSWVKDYLNGREVKNKTPQNTSNLKKADSPKLNLIPEKSLPKAAGWYPLGASRDVQYYDGENWTDFISTLPKTVHPRDFRAPKGYRAQFKNPKLDASEDRLTTEEIEIWVKQEEAKKAQQDQ